MDRQTILNQYFCHPKDNPLNIVNTFNCPPSEIIPGLWIGNFYDSENEALIRNLEIGAIVNLTGSIRKLYVGIVHLVVLIDQPFNNSKPAALEAIEFIALIRKKRDVMVHCLGGVDRAPTVVQKYLVDYHGMSEDNAAKLIKSKRPQALPHWDWWG
ncbi:MAG TPA: dual specificity protein phosphatase [Candidatus Eisenbacteria bacterium]|nr:dual specificity protein phosphatase [Candidatus Eisenbacteria bacterium]